MGIRKFVIEQKQNLLLLLISVLLSFGVSVNFSNPSWHRLEIVLDTLWIFFIFMVLRLALNSRKVKQ